MDERESWTKRKNNVRYVNESFFNKWSPDMAYVLGFFAADGCLTENRKRGNKYIEFVLTDKDIIEKIRYSLKSTHKISMKQRKIDWQIAYRIQIGSKIMFQSLVDLGFTPKKSLTLQFPSVPPALLPDFIRGYFDGDGCISFGSYSPRNRASKKFIIARFTSGRKEFLEDLSRVLINHAGLKKGSIFSGSVGAFNLAYSKDNSIKLFKYLYYAEDIIYLERKYQKYSNALLKFGVVA